MEAKLLHTEGPWDWFENMPGRPYLATPDRGRLYVMGFERKGMQGATPMFARWPGQDEGLSRRRTGGLMMPGIWLPDGRMHPDARLIKAAPMLLAAMKQCLPLVDDYGGTASPEAIAARAAIAEAEGVRHG